MLRYAVWDFGREMATKLRFGSRSEKFGNRCHRQWRIWHVGKGASRLRGKL